MRTLTRAMTLTLAAALIALFAIACSSGGGADRTTSEQPAGETDGSASEDLVSAAPMEVLSASAESFDQEVESLRMEMDFRVAVGEFAIDSSSEMAFQAPDQMHVTMDLTGLGSFEMLMLGTDIYVNIPEQGWLVMSLDDLSLGDLGLDAEAFQDSLSNHSMVDYGALVESVGGDVEDLGEETVDGGTYRHYRGTVDLADVASAFGDTFGATGGMGLEDVSGPMTFDAWVDPETFLPHVLTMTGEFALGADAMVLDASMRFSGYNEPVEMPDPPEDAVPFTLPGGP